MTNRLALGLMLAAILGAANARAEADAPAAHVLRVSGAVEVTSPGQPGWRPAHAGLALSVGAALRTGDAGRAEVSLASGTVRVYENSLLRVSGPEANSERVELGEGAGLFDIKLPRGKQFRVETPEAVAAVKGTRFLVEAARGAISAGVFEGIVELRKLGAGAVAPVLVREGFSATLGDDAFEIMVLDRPDPWHEWESGAVLVVPPPPAAQDEGGDGPVDAREAVREVREAVHEATDAVLDADLDLGLEGRNGNGGAARGEARDAWAADQAADGKPFDGQSGVGNALGAPGIDHLPGDVLDRADRTLDPILDEDTGLLPNLLNPPAKSN